MPGFIELLGAAKTDAEGRTSYQLYPDWMQGRAVYGGLSAALCLDGVLKQHDDLPPLRSATINFIGPGDDVLTVESKVLRRGKSVSFVQAELVSGSGLIVTLRAIPAKSRQNLASPSAYRGMLRLRTLLPLGLHGDRHISAAPHPTQANHPDDLIRIDLFTGDTPPVSL